MIASLAPDHFLISNAVYYYLVLYKAIYLWAIMCTMPSLATYYFFIRNTVYNTKFGMRPSIYDLCK